MKEPSRPTESSFSALSLRLQRKPRMARIRSIPFLLAGMVALLAVLTVVHVMLTSVRNRRRDVAVLRALGADGPWVSRAVHWQATTFSLVPLAIGVPLG